MGAYFACTARSSSISLDQPIVNLQVRDDNNNWEFFFLQVCHMRSPFSDRRLVLWGEERSLVYWWGLSKISGFTFLASCPGEVPLCGSQCLMGRIAKVKLTLNNGVGSACASTICTMSRNDKQLHPKKSLWLLNSISNFFRMALHILKYILCDERLICCRNTLFSRDSVSWITFMAFHLCPPSTV